MLFVKKMSKETQSWMRWVFIVIGVLSVVIALVAMMRPLLTLELVLFLIPIVLLMNGISWIIQGAVGK